ncbi:hypothetical protein NLX69_17535 [Rossellomorea sp. BNER]|nr:hypothetical protein [Rossellomorea sp. BNER]
MHWIWILNDREGSTLSSSSSGLDGRRLVIKKKPNKWFWIIWSIILITLLNQSKTDMQFAGEKKGEMKNESNGRCKKN